MELGPLDLKPGNVGKDLPPGLSFPICKLGMIRVVLLWSSGEVWRCSVEADPRQCVK